MVASTTAMIAILPLLPSRLPLFHFYFSFHNHMYFFLFCICVAYMLWYNSHFHKTSTRYSSTSVYCHDPFSVCKSMHCLQIQNTLFSWDRAPSFLMFINIWGQRNKKAIHYILFLLNISFYHTVFESIVNILK